MNKIYIIALFIFFFAASGFANNPPGVPFAKTYGGPGDDVAYGVVSVDEKGYFVTGYTTSSGEGGKDVFLMHIDISGDVQWFKTYGGSNDDIGLNIREARDGGFFLLGTTKSCGGSDEDGYLVKTDSAGNLEWTKVIGGADRDLLTEIYERPNGEIVAMLKPRSYIHNNGFLDYYTVIISNNATHTVSRGYAMGEQYNDHGNDFVELPNGDLLFCGVLSEAGAPSLGASNGWLLRTDKNGEPYSGKDQFAYGVPNSNEYTRFHAIKKLSPYSNLVVAETKQMGSSEYDIILGKVDNNGDSIWFKRYIDTNNDWYPKLFVDGNNVVIGSRSNSLGNGNYDLRLTATDSNGTHKWTKSYGSFKTDEIFDANNEFVNRGIDDGYIMVSANSEFSANGDLDIYIVKTGANGEAPIGHVKSNTIITKKAALSIQKVKSFSKNGRVDNPGQTECGTENEVTNFKHNQEWTGNVTVGVIDLVQVDLPTFDLYPNPIKGVQTVNLAGNETLEKYAIYSATQLVSSGQIVNGQAQIDCSQMAAGVYFIKVNDAEGRMTMKKLIVTK